MGICSLLKLKIKVGIWWKLVLHHGTLNLALYGEQLATNIVFYCVNCECSKQCEHLWQGSTQLNSCVKRLLMKCLTCGAE